ncbi:MAG TPA: MFS transporter [Acidimicrobiales bacterium]|nr:MFS transporter [Acidimicrobiales bacterium]
MTGDRTRAALVTPAFLTVVLVGLVYWVGFNMVIPELPPFVTRELGGSSLAVGLIVGAPALTAVFTRPVAGRLGNRFGRKVLMIGGAATAGGAIAAYGLTSSEVALAALRLATGVGQGLFFTGAATLVSDIAPPARRGEAMSYFSIAAYMGTGLGPLTGQLLAEQIGLHAVFGVAGLFCVAGALLSLRAPNVRIVAGAGLSRPGLFNRKGVGPGLVMMFGLMGYTAFQAYAPLYTVRQLHLSGPAVAFLLYAGIILVCRLAFARLFDRVGARRCASTATLTIAAGLVVIAAWPTVTGLYVGVAVFSLGMAVQYPALFTMAVNRANERDRAPVIGTFTAFLDLATGLGGVTLGAVAALAGYRASFVGGAVAALLGFAVLQRLFASPATS